MPAESGLDAPLLPQGSTRTAQPQSAPHLNGTV